MIRRVLCILGLFVIVCGATQAAQQSKDLIIKVPEGLDNRLLVLVGTYGNGLTLEKARLIGPTEYAEKLYDFTTSVKLLIYNPKYKAIAVTLDPKTVSASKPFIPKFVKAKMVPLRVRVVDSAGKPIVGQSFIIGSDLHQMEYFNYADGMVDSSDIARVVTGSSGEFSAQVPSLPDDPYFAKHNDLSFGLCMPHGRELTASEGPFGYDIVPAGIPAQRSYPKTLVRTVVYRGKVRGKVEKSFLNRYGIEPWGQSEKGPTILARKHGEKSAGGRTLSGDNAFDLGVSAGTYDLTVEWQEGKRFRSVSALKDVVVGEREDKTVVID